MAHTNENVEVSEAQIAAHWREEELIGPSAGFVAQANMADPSVFERFSEKNFPECFREYADLLTWDRYWHTTLDTSNPPFWKWFVGGRLNVSYNCIDRHLAGSKNKAAFIWVPEKEEEEDRVVTYQDLYVRVNEFAALLQGLRGGQDGGPGHIPYAHAAGAPGLDGSPALDSASSTPRFSAASAAQPAVTE